jgi:diguanylate cyclase (GGDEF)-like protein
MGVHSNVSLTRSAEGRVVTFARNVLLAAALVTVVGGALTAPGPPPWWRFILAIGGMAVAHLLRQRVRAGATVFYLGWGEAALIMALQLVPAGWVPAALLAGYLAAVGVRLLRHREPPPRTTAEVSAVITVAAGAGALISSGFGNAYGSPLTPSLAVGLVLAALAYLLVTTAGAHMMSRLRWGSPVAPMLHRTFGYKLPMAAGSVAIGLTAIAVGHADWRWLLILPPVLWLLHNAYGQQIRAGQRRRMWTALATATRSLNRADEELVAGAGAHGALEVFAVGRAEIALGPPGGPWRTWLAEAGGAVQSVSSAGQAGPESPTRRRAWVVPLLAGAEQIGQLRVYFPDPGEPGDEELAALQAYADALTAALHDTATRGKLHQVLTQSTHDAQHDPLTGLLNRAALLARGETAVQLLRHGTPVALLLVDVDHFREINDTLGHAAGDEVLAVTGQRLQESADAGDLVGRLAGDEFAVLVTNPGGATLAEAQERMVRRGRELVALLAEQATICGVPVSIEASVGLVVAPAGTADMTELLRRAAAGMQQAKVGGGTIGWYDVTQDAGGSDRPALLAELRAALDRNDELTLVMQPVLDLTTGAPVTVEALVRWRHPQRGLLPPAEFVRTVENSDLLGKFTEYVLDRALTAAAGWYGQQPTVPVAVNLSARSLLDPRLPGVLTTLLHRHRLPGRALILEITETAVTSDLPGIEEALTRLRALGVGLSVDDFGTGYASLTLLTRVPLDEVKVDGKFIARMAESVEAAAIVRTTVELGRELGVRVVAESVETAAQRQLLTELGCPAGQGFLLAVPTAPEGMGEMLRQLDAAVGRVAHRPIQPVQRPASESPA